MKRKLVKLLIASLVLVSVVGCSPKQSEENRGPVELKVFMSFPRFQEQFEAYFEQFSAKMKEEKGIDVTIKLEMPNPDSAGQILKTRLASNDAPDVFTLHAIADLPSFAEAGYLEDLSTQPFVDSLYPSVKDIVTYNGQVKALPLESLAWGYLYNKDMFDKYGLTPAQTLQEMEHVIEVLKENNETPFLLAFQESWIPQLMMALSLGGTVSADHPQWIENMNNGTASYEDVKSVFNIIDMIMENGTEKPFEVGSSAGSADFANGKAAMWVQGPWMAESILSVNKDMNIGVAPLPVSNDPKAAMVNLAVSTSLGVSPNSENKDIALELVNYILDQKDSSALFEQLKFNPLAEVHNYDTFPWVNEAMDYAGQGKAYQDLSLPNGVTDETAKMLQSYYTKEVTIEQIIEALDRTWQAAVKAGN